MTSCFLLAQDSSLYLRVHSGEKLFKCDQCSYLSTRAWNLKLHKLNHTGETPYKCGQCHYPTVCGQNANERLAYCPDFYCGWHFVRPNFWLAFCLDHLNMFCQNHEKCRHLSECEWSFVRSVDFLPYRQKANLAKSQSLMTLVGHSYEAHFHNSKCSEDDIWWSERFSYVLRRFHYIRIVLRLFSQKKHQTPLSQRQTSNGMAKPILYHKTHTAWQKSYCMSFVMPSYLPCIHGKTHVISAPPYPWLFPCSNQRLTFWFQNFSVLRLLAIFWEYLFSGGGENREGKGGKYLEKISQGYWEVSVSV